MSDKTIIFDSDNEEVLETAEVNDSVEDAVILSADENPAEEKLQEPSVNEDVVHDDIEVTDVQEPVVLQKETQVQGEGFTMEEPAPNVTYGGGFTMEEPDPDIVHGSGFTMKESDPDVVHGEGFTMEEPLKPAVPAVAATSKPVFYDDTQETAIEEHKAGSYGLKGYEDSHYRSLYGDDKPEIDDERRLIGNRETRHGDSTQDSNGGGNKSGYVTKKFLAGALAITLVLSTLLGGLLGSYFGRRGNEQAQESVTTEEPAPEAVPPSADDKLSVEQVVNQNADAVVEINTTVVQMSMFGKMTGEGAGSGVIVREDGFIVTNYHVIKGARSVTVTLHNGSEYSAQIVGYDESNDIAVLKIAAEGLAAITPGDSDSLKVGDTAIAIGNPLGQLGGTATSGIISALDRTITMDNGTLTLLQTDAAINPGNSGGGLFDANGKLIGVVVAKSSGTGIEGLGFAIPINIARPIYESIIENGNVTEKPMAGISIYNVPSGSTEYYGVSEPGVYIGEVTGINARRAGLEVGDRIVAFNDREVTNSGELVAMIQEHSVGDEVTFTVSRDGQMIDITFALEASTNL